jgi:uncharacterized iron-regulated membrane protein
MMQKNPPAGTNPTGETMLAARQRGLRSLLWRIHFWAALIASPFALMATLTGILYIFTPQIEGVLYARLERVTPIGAMLPLDEAVAAAQAAAPMGLILRSVQPAFEAHDTVKVLFVADTNKEGEHEGHHPRAQPTTIHVNPYTAEVLGSLANEDRFSNWALNLHSSLLQGDSWRWMIELAASALMVMLLSGVWLWWPRGGANLRGGLPQAGAKGRIAWKQWHGFIGVALSVISLVILTTGLTWSKYAGDQIRTVRDLAGQAPPRMPRGLSSTLHEGAVPLSWQAVWDIARRTAPNRPFQLSGVGRVDRVGGVVRVRVPDRGEPTMLVDMALDAYSGSVMYYAGWERQTAFSKATAVGIPFHRGEFGWWNQALLLIFGLGVLFSLVSGWVMYWKRRSASSRGGGSVGGRWLPPLLPGAWQAGRVPVVVMGVVLCIGMPVLAVAVVLVMVAELLPRVGQKVVRKLR